MDAKTAMNLMIDNSGKTPAELSNAMGRGRSYVYQMRKQKSVPRVDTFARFCHECGYKLKLERADGRQIELYSDADAVERSGKVLGESKDSIFKPGHEGYEAVKSDPAALYIGDSEGTAWGEETEAERDIYAMAVRLQDDGDFRARFDEQYEDPGYDDEYRADDAYWSALQEAAYSEAQSRYLSARKRGEEAFFKKPGASQPPEDDSHDN